MPIRWVRTFHPPAFQTANQQNVIHHNSQEWNFEARLLPSPSILSTFDDQTQLLYKPFRPPKPMTNHQVEPKQLAADIR